MSSIPNKKSAVTHVMVEPGQGGRRLDNFLMGNLRGVPKARIYQMIRKGEVRVNGGRSRPEYRICAGDRVRLPPVTMATARAPGPLPGPLVDEMGRNILYRDDDLIVVNKPPGLVVHSGSGRTFGVIDLVRRAVPGGESLQLVHRLDRDTSGCLLVAANPQVLRHLHGLLREGRVRKHYLALLEGTLPGGTVTVDRPLDRNRVRGGERVVEVADGGRHAISRFKAIRHYRNSTLCRVLIDTGRTHQIRVHALHLGHPVAGDEKYGTRDFNRVLRAAGLRRMFLHAARIVVPAFEGRAAVDIEAPLPAALSDFLSRWS